MVTFRVFFDLREVTLDLRLRKASITDVAVMRRFVLSKRAGVVFTDTWAFGHRRSEPVARCGGDLRRVRNTTLALLGYALCVPRRCRAYR